ncbi:MAG: hypothetical protein ABI229_05665 [Gemmatimonadaceae bacterium]
MPLYNTATTAAALDVTPKWLDNMLSHNNIDGLRSESQGVARRLSLATITTLAVAKELIDAMGLPTPAALRLALQINNNVGSELALSPHLHITIQLDALKIDVLTRLARAVEVAPTPRRGRPPKR